MKPGEFPTRRFYKLFVEKYILCEAQERKALSRALTLSGPAGKRHYADLLKHGCNRMTFAEKDAEAYGTMVSELTRIKGCKATTHFGDVSDLDGKLYSYIDLDFMRSMRTQRKAICKMLKQQRNRKGSKLFTFCVALAHGSTCKQTLEIVGKQVLPLLGAKALANMKDAASSNIGEYAARWVWQHAEPSDRGPCPKYGHAHSYRIGQRLSSWGRIDDLSTFLYLDGTSRQMMAFSIAYR